jgi:hypothetical protein
VILPVSAAQPGRSGNLPAGSLAALEGPLGLSLTVTNPTSTRGGTDRRVPAPGASDYERLSETLRASLRLTALQEFAAQLGPDGALLPATLALYQVNEEAFDPPEVQPADWLHLSLRLEFQALAVSGDDLRSLAGRVLDANLPDGFLPVPDSLILEPLSPPVVGKDGLARWRLKAARSLRPQLADSQAVLLARGLPPALAEQRLSAGLPLASPPRISMSPSWWPRLPFIPFRIEVINRGIGD